RPAAAADSPAARAEEEPGSTVPTARAEEEPGMTAPAAWARAARPAPAAQEARSMRSSAPGAQRAAARVGPPWGPGFPSPAEPGLRAAAQCRSGRSGWAVEPRTRVRRKGRP